MFNFSNMRSGLRQEFTTFLMVSTILLTVWSYGSDAAPSNPECGEEMLVKCSYPLKTIFNDNQDLSFATKKEELEQLCPDLNEGLRCIDEYTRKCLEPHQRSHFNLLYTDTSMVIQEICKQTPYQEEFLRHAPCMRLVKEDYEECTNNYQQKLQAMNNQSLQGGDSEQKVKKLCCSFQEYLRCSKAIVMDRCGEDTATFTEGFLRRMSTSLIKIHCEKYPIESECVDADSGVQLPRLSFTSLFAISLVLTGLLNNVRYFRLLQLLT
ncbi:uncharacterized protein LOC142323620 [Lycorma delicatula]|uniref:uncharacterized protein LOC142323620 n=1 Tax=Lycorma delicatula TaxID=130591 RepID=UPI003F51709E